MQATGDAHATPPANSLVDQRFAIEAGRRHEGLTMSSDAASQTPGAATPVVIAGTVEPDKGQVLLRTSGLATAPSDIELRAGDALIFRQKAGAGGEFVNAMPFAEALRHDWSRLQLVIGGQPAAAGAHKFTGDFFEAVTITDRGEFFDKLQINHLRFKIPFLLDVGAQTAVRRFRDEFEVPAAALTIMAHRFLDRKPMAISDAERARVLWIIAEARKVVDTGQKLIANAASPDWRDVRWTISLATVAGYLSLILNDVSGARRFFETPVKHVLYVKVARVSALNLVNGCYVHGLLSAFEGDKDAARASFERGLTSLPELAGAQDLLENAWVSGDMMNVARACHQCFIALVRFDLFDASKAPGPVIEASQCVSLGEIKSPLKHILSEGCAPAVLKFIAERGGG